MKRVVCDTNIYISAFIFPGGNPDQVLELARQGLIELYTSHFILGEFRQVLREKFRLSEPTIEELVERIRHIATILQPKIKLAVILEKDDDNRVLECAVEARAHYLVTGDTKHIQPLKEYQGIKIYSPAEFLRLGLWL
jgi:putative PIN family toxin of toxin-antitoxin system